MIAKSLFSYTSNPVQDLILSRRILEGETELFQLLIKPYKKDLYYAIRSFSKDHRCIDETFSNTYHWVARNLYQFHAHVPFRVWLISNGIREAQLLALNRDSAGSDLPDVRNSELDNIPDFPRIVFVLRRLLDFTNNQVSYCLRIPNAEVKQYEAISTKLLGNSYKLISKRGTYFDDDNEKLIDQYLANHPMPYNVVQRSNETATRKVELKSDAQMQKLEHVVQYLKNEHQENLKLCFNIRSGFVKGIEMHRIKRYTDWYWRQHLSAHFFSEENIIFPILGKENELVKKAMAEHRRLQRLFESKKDINKVLSRIEEELESHIRFEERVLFKEIERTGTDGGKAKIEMLHEHHAEPVWIDKFWKESQH